MSDLVDWLRAQIDEDERIAREARPGYFTSTVLGTFSSFTDSRHVITHNPVRVLAEVDAKRRLIDEHAEHVLADGTGTGECRVCAASIDMEIFPCITVRLIAAPYADKPGYREEWRP